ncbi:class C sortase [Corynebacterium uropygiale]|uniref:Class C sortase n=1 Tax=Corynebacterium uropygiale TaxID=1775911 RepID=A0A9X1QP82_9CORY|nr:class C sortase [Corynebacterium uropygiale]MCF4006819.1 class C sortase [Corynebacterium uropygiale]
MRRVISLLVVLIGIGIVLYPVATSTWSNIQQQEEARSYSADADARTDELLAENLAAARAWNATHPVRPLSDPWEAGNPDTDPEYREYLGQLALNDIMGRIVIPSINVDLPIRHGSGEDSLAHGVGHLYGTSLPVGGEGTHASLTGHTGMTSATMFDNLTDVQVGARIILDVSGEQMVYEVHATEVVLPDQTESLAAQPGEDLLTLITCTPYGSNTHRLLVHAHRVEAQSGDLTTLEERHVPWQWWMTAVCVVVAILLLWLIWEVARSVRGRGAHRHRAG